jgi:hypothetical protein
MPESPCTLETDQKRDGHGDHCENGYSWSNQGFYADGSIIDLDHELDYLRNFDPGPTCPGSCSYVATPQR